MSSITLSEIMNGPWLERAVYTAEERAIPSFADGLKPVQRFLVCKAIKDAHTKFDKVASLSTIAAIGYHHGEQSAASALTAMAADFSNNLPIFEGDGNFGNVLNPAAAAPRYIFARLSPLFDDLFKDMDLCPPHEDPEHVPPKYYLPIIPIVLVNGIRGIATCYATDIPPHDPVTIIKWLIDRANPNKIPEPIKPKYYGFTGKVEECTGYYAIHGEYEYLGTTKIHVTELPRGYTCASYDAHLKKLIDKGTILDFENNSRMNKFDYIVQLKRGTKWTDEQVRKFLKLDTTHSWNLTTVSTEGKIQEWPKETGIHDIMNAFYKFRIPFIQQRIDNKIDYLETLLQYQNALQQFCQDVIENKFSFRGITDQQFHDILANQYKTPEQYISKIMNLPVRYFTKELFEKLSEDLKTTEKELVYYRKTTAEKEYTNDLTALLKAYNKYMAEREE